MMTGRVRGDCYPVCHFLLYLSHLLLSHDKTATDRTTGRRSRLRVSVSVSVTLVGKESECSKAHRIRGYLFLLLPCRDVEDLC